MKLSEIKPNPNNPRVLRDERFISLVKSLLEFPKMLRKRKIVLDSLDKPISLGGNMRFRGVEYIVKLKESEFNNLCEQYSLIAENIEVWQQVRSKKVVPDNWIDYCDDFTEDEKRRFIIADNVGFGDWDWDALGNDWDAEQLTDWGLEIPGWKEEEAEAEEDDFDVPEGGIETDIVLGDLFEIGQHRILCGDSTDSEQVAKLMNGEKADMVFTDPPYLMDFTGGIHADGSKSFNSKHGGIKNDKMSDKDGDDFLDAINSNIILFCKGAFYISFYRLGIDKYFASMKRVGLQYRALIIWNKGNHTLSNSDYMSKYEPIFYGWVNEHNFYGGNNGMDIWDIERTQKNDLHPTMKPIPLCEKGISDGSLVNGIVLDLFLGSGSTMVAAHQLNRKCYGMELDPKYCQVIIDRMTKLDETIQVKINGKDYVKAVQ